MVNYAGKENIKQIRNIIIIATTITCSLYLLWVCTVTGLLDSRGVSSSKDLTLADCNKNHKYTLRKYVYTSFIEVLFEYNFGNLFYFAINRFFRFLDRFIEAELQSKGKLIAAGLAFVPPWLIANYFDNIFVNAFG